MQAKDLTMFESVLLLGLKPEGSPVSSQLHLALAAGVLFELERLDRIAVVSEGRKIFIELRNSASTGMEMLDDALKQIETAKRRKRIEGWVATVARTKNLRVRAADRLVSTGVLASEPGTIAFVFPTTRLPEQNDGPENELRFWIDQAINGGAANRSTATLVGIVFRSGLLKPAGDRAIKKAVRSRVDTLTAGDPWTEAVKKAVANQAAAMV